METLVECTKCQGWGILETLSVLEGTTHKHKCPVCQGYGAIPIEDAEVIEILSPTKKYSDDSKKPN